MAQFSYSFCMSMLHSLWQAGILALIYFLAEISLQQKFTPLQKKNLLFISVFIQAVLLIVTFFTYYFNAESNLSTGIINETVTRFLSADIIHTVTPWLFTAYLIAMGYKILRAVVDWYFFKKQLRQGLQKPAVDLKLFTILKANHFGIKRKVTLWLSNVITTPVTFGFIKPVIILPVALVNQITLHQAETLILHELTHIKANDYLLNWFLIIAENVFFFNPFVFSLCKKIRLEREKHCDINVVAFQYSPLVYAETLLQAQLVKQYVSQYQLAATGRQQQLLQRIQFFTAEKNQGQKRNNRLIFPLLASVLIMVFIAAIFFQYKFTAGKIVAVETPVASVSEINKEIITPAFVNNILENFTDEKLKNIQAIVEKQQPIIEKQLKQLEPLIKAIQNKAEAFAQGMDENFAAPAAIQENDATRQIVIREEQSGSKNAVVKVYTLSFVNGKWVLQPQWKLAAKEIPVRDSLNKTIDTSLPEQEDAY